MQVNAPIILFVYNRPDLTLSTLNALSANYLSAQSHLIIYADGPKENASQDAISKISQTRSIIRKRKWCSTVKIIEAETNKGLSKSVIEGVTEVLTEYEVAIILEDDLVTGKNFLNYMNFSLRKYEEDKRVFQISGFSYSLTFPGKKDAAFFLPFTTSWGWGTWRRAWNHFDSKAYGYERLKSDHRLSYRFDLNGVYPYSAMLIRQMEGSGIDSWAIRWWWIVFQKKGFVLYPSRSLVSNIGFGKDATHTTESNDTLNAFFDKEVNIQLFPDEVSVNKKTYKTIRKFIWNNIVNRDRFNRKRYFYFAAKNIVKRILMFIQSKRRAVIL